jgi:hypothetical protein
MKKQVPDLLQLQDIVPLYWSEVSERNSRRSPEKFFDLSKRREDPPFRYLVITTDQYHGFDEYYMICYFDVAGNWITQSAFDTLKEALSYAEYAFRVQPNQWFEAAKIESDSPDK